MLRVNLVSVFMVDEIRRILCEAIIPYLTQNKDQISKDVQAKIKKAKTVISKKKVGDDGAEKDTASESTKSMGMISEEIIDEEIEELEKEEVETFDDYLEMIMTFGYITLFASAFPLGTTITSIFIYLDIFFCTSCQ